MALASLHKFVQLTLVLTALAVCGTAALAQSQASDMKPGSVLFYNKYTSNPTNPQAEDTQISITNTNATESASVHLFFVDGNTCTPADAFIVLTPSQTASFLASDFDPGTQGYIIAVAVGSSGGVSGPTQFNFLIGDLLIRESSGHLAGLAAVSFRKNTGGATNNGDGTATLNFGVDYDPMPSTVAVSSFNSQTTHSTLLAIYSPTNNLIMGTAFDITVSTLVFDDQERSYSTSFRIRCYNQIPLGSLRVLSNGLNSIVPAGRTGWVRMTGSGVPLLGAVLTKGSIFNGAHNFHTLATTSYSITVPAF